MFKGPVERPRYGSRLNPPSALVPFMCCRLVVSPGYLVAVVLRLLAPEGGGGRHCELFQQTIDGKVYPANPFVFNEIAIIEGF